MTFASPDFAKSQPMSLSQASTGLSSSGLVILSVKGPPANFGKASNLMLTTSAASGMFTCGLILSWAATMVGHSPIANSTRPTWYRSIEILLIIVSKPVRLHFIGERCSRLFLVGDFDQIAIRVADIHGADRTCCSRAPHWPL